jgi:hypothetical protein
MTTMERSDAFRNYRPQSWATFLGRAASIMQFFTITGQLRAYSRAIKPT